MLWFERSATLADCELKGMKELDLRECKEMKVLSPDIGRIKNLEKLSIPISCFEILADSIGFLSKLKEFIIEGTYGGGGFDTFPLGTGQFRKAFCFILRIEAVSCRLFWRLQEDHQGCFGLGRY